MVEINNLTTISIKEEFLRKVAQKVLEGENKKEADLSIAFLGPGRMRQINKRYRGKNKVTDVLAFPETKILKERPSTRAKLGAGLVPHRNEVSGAGFKVGPLQKIQGLGEIVICLREVKKNVKRFGTSFERELTKVLIHGILHLLGYNHEKSEAKAKKMEEKEKYYLSQIINI